jgi:peptidoglycan/xylan/chitin deacetylase (PgdA/CDA1 family)
MYHGIGGPDGLPPAVFAAQLDQLRTRRRVVSLTQAIAALGSPEACELAAITFDDGYKDFAGHAVPALAQRELPSTLFVPAAWMGRNNGWDAGLAPERALLSASELRALDPKLVTIGAHGLHHVRLAGLSGERLNEETAGARKLLEDSIGRSVQLFAYPYGQLDDFDRSAEQAVQAAGFTSACTTHYGRSNQASDLFRLRRVGIAPWDSVEQFVHKLDGAYDWVAWKERGSVAKRRINAAFGRSR